MPPNDNILTVDNTTTARQAYERVPDHKNNFVISGCELDLDTDTNELSADPGTITITNGGTVYLIDVVARRGADAIGVPDNSQLNVYYDVVPNDVVVQASAPPAPSLQIGTVDTSAGTVSDDVNREPEIVARKVDGDLDVEGALSTDYVADTTQFPREVRLNGFFSTSSTSYTTIGDHNTHLIVDWDALPALDSASYAIFLTGKFVSSNGEFVAASSDGFGSFSTDFPDTQIAGDVGNQVSSPGVIGSNPSGINHYLPAFRSTDGNSTSCRGPSVILDVIQQ